jgi:hypothetical protein
MALLPDLERSRVSHNLRSRNNLNDAQWCLDLIKELKKEYRQEIQRVQTKSLEEQRNLKSLHEIEIGNLRQSLKETDRITNQFANEQRNLLQEIAEVLG